jgi:serine/threonine protein kinase
VVERPLFRVLVCKSCGERYDAAGMEGISCFPCAGCGRDLAPRSRLFPGWGGKLSKNLREAALERFGLKEVATKRDRRIGEYKVLSQVARGGMGVVYRAIHLGTGETVALKVLHGRRRRSERNMIQRFRHEARIAQSIEHPNIIPVFEVGHARGMHFFSMRYVEGLTLDCHLESREFSLHKGLRWLAEVADALDTIHQHGVVHRDVKPGNILIDEADEPYIFDFGLAKNIEASVHLTRPGMAMGTPAYMSPEQAEGERKVDGRADVYSLGAVLFEMICGRPPFRGESLMETMLMVVSETMPNLRDHAPDVDPRLEAICLKALQKDRNRRYQTARALREDLIRFLEGRPVSARPASLREKVIDKVQRYKYPGLMFLTSIAGGLGAIACVLALSGKL